MGRILGLLSLLVSVSAFSAQPSMVPGIGAGQFGTNGPSAWFTPSDIYSSTGWFTLIGGDTNVALVAGDFYPLYKNGVVTAGAAYQVTAGKTAYCEQIVCGSGANVAQLVSSTAAITFGQSTSPAGGVYMGGQSGKYPISCPAAYAWFPGGHQFTASTYAGFQVAAAAVATMSMRCIEK